MKVIIETERLFIREIVSNDIDYLLAIYNNTLNLKYIPNSNFSWNRENLIEKYDRINKGYKTGFGIFVVELKNGHVIGEAGLFDSFNNKDHFELGYILDNRFWGKGLGFETCESLIKYGFRKLNLKKLTARMFQDNIASVKLSEKCGMQLVRQGKVDSGESYCEYEIERIT